VPDHKEARVIPKSKGLKGLKAEIMRSNSVFLGEESLQESRVPTRTFDSRNESRNSSTMRQGNSSFRENDELKLFRMYIGHKDSEVNQNLGKSRSSNHVSASRMKMFYNSQIKI